LGNRLDNWGQIFFIETSDPNMRWMDPSTLAVRYGDFAPLSPSLVENSQRVRPTSGLEFVSSRHFPDNVQGDILFHNTIGFLGTKQHAVQDDGTGFKSFFRQDLLKCRDGNVRPVDLEFAPDGSLYFLDWHNVLVGHMQHSARDPLRDHVHGRVYRITYPSRPLVTPAPVAGASIAQLLNNLKEPEYRTRYRTRRELRGRNPESVLPALRLWIGNLDASDPGYEHHLVEAMWVMWGMNRLEETLVRQLLAAGDFHARAAAVQAIRYNRHRLSNHNQLLSDAAQDPHGRVRLSVILAASWLSPDQGIPIIEKAAAHGLDDWMKPSYDAAIAQLSGRHQSTPEVAAPQTTLTGKDRQLFLLGAEVYRREGHCITCHQPDGLGLPAAQFPPLAESEWVTGNEKRLIQLTLHGLLGPIQVKGVDYPGLVPMTAFKGLSDEEIAGVLTFVRNSFGNSASPVTPDAVAAVRRSTLSQKTFYNPDDLMKTE
ncbi:MAG: c-type cytochrome, partial [Verrucomicrobia bacterium]|nr:c-type cytochrome [Verrucomicrobiota bacterium]